MSNTSVRSYATEHINHVGVTENTPFDTVAAMEDILSAWKENAVKGMITPITRETDTASKYEKKSSPSMQKIVSLVGLSISEEIEAMQQRRYKRSLSRRAAKQYSRTFGQYKSTERDKAEAAIKSPVMEPFYLCQTTDKRCETSPNHWIELDDEMRGYLKQSKCEIKPRMIESPCKDFGLSKLNHAIEKHKSLQNWIEEQNRPQQPENYQETEEKHFSLPPLLNHIRIEKEHRGEKKKAHVSAKLADKAMRHGWTIKGKYAPKSHLPSYYKIVCKSGRVVDLSQQEGRFKPVLMKNPTEAMRFIATRIGFKGRGGETELINKFLKATKITNHDENGVSQTSYKWITTHVSKFIDGQWFTTIGWALNPKISSGDSHRITVKNEGSHPSIHWTSQNYIEATPGGIEIPPYWVTETDELTKTNPNRFIDQKGNTCFLTAEHDDYQAPLTLSQLDYHLLCESNDLAVEDENGEVVEFMNEEEEFLTMFPQRESNETFIDFSKYCEDDAEMELFQSCSGVIERSEGGITLGDLESSQYVEYLSNGIKTTGRTLQKLRNQEPSDAVDKIIENMEKHLARLKRLDGYWNQFVGTKYNESPPAQATFGAKGDFREPLKCLPFMSEEPLNLIEAPLAQEVEVMPEHRVVTYSWLNALSTKLMVKRELEARRGQVFKAVNDGTLKVQLAFSHRFEQMLGLA